MDKNENNKINLNLDSISKDLSGANLEPLKNIIKSSDYDSTNKDLSEISSSSLVNRDLNGCLLEEDSVDQNLNNELLSNSTDASISKRR